MKNIFQKSIAATLISLLIITTTALPTDNTKDEAGELLWTYDSDLFVEHVFTAELTGDTIPDVIAAEYDSDHYDDISKVYGINGADGSTLWTYTLNDGARCMTVGDINYDGIMDAVVGASKGSTTPDGKIHAIDGSDGSPLWVFTPGTTGDTNGDVAVGNFNGDNYLDVAVACWDDFVYAIDGETGLELWNYEIDSIFVNAVSTADVDGDGIDDVSYAHEYLAGWDNEIGILNGSTGDVIWNQIISKAGLNTLLADIDDDGDIEAIYAVEHNDDDVEIQVRNGLDGTLEWSTVIGTASMSPTVYLSAFDLDEDADLDLIVGNEWVDFYIRAYDGDSSSLMWTSEELNGYPKDLSFADVNGSGTSNIVCGTYDRVQILDAADGTKNWYYSVAGTIQGTTVGDFNDDGIVDVACSGGAEYTGSNPGKGVWALATTDASPVLWEFDVQEYGNAIAMGDFNDDNMLDVIGVTSLTDTAWAVNGPTGEELWNWSSTANLYTVCTGDFNGDGTDDAAVAGDDEQVTALNGLTGTVLWQFTEPTDQLYRKCLQSADLNDDGKVDVIAGCDDSYVYAINGEDGNLLWSVDCDGSVRDIDVLDINNDTVADVLAAASNELLIIDGKNGSILWQYTGASSAKHAEMLDVNNDGIQDVAWASYSTLALVDGASLTELWSLSTTVNSDYCLQTSAINDDAIPDVIYTGGDINDYNVIAVHGMNGSTIWEVPTGGEVNCILSSNVDDDTKKEIVAGSDDQFVYVIDPDGTIQWSYSTADDVMHLGVGDLTGDNAVDIAAITFGSDGIIYAFDSLATSQETYDIYVDDDAEPGWYDATHVKTIQEGINNASQGYTVYVYNGSYYEHIIIDKTLTLIGENKHSTIIDGQGYDEVVNIYGDFITMTGFTIQNSSHQNGGRGIRVYFSNNHTITNNIIQNCYRGILLYSSNHTSITNTTFHSNHNGIIGNFNHHIIISNNTIFNNENDGIHLGDIFDSFITSNYIANNGDNGLSISDSFTILISQNEILENENTGIYTTRINDSIIKDNIIQHNLITGIFFNQGQRNLVYNNYFNNSENYVDFGTTQWNISKTPGTNIIGGPYLGGNFWSDYMGNDTDGDGLGDTNIPYGPGDFLPLVHIAAQLDVEQTTQDRGFPVRHAVDGDWAGAQNFTPTFNHVSKVELYMRVFGTPEFDLTVELRLDHPQGTLLDTQVFAPEQVPSSWEWFPVDFTDQLVDPDSNVFIVIPPAPSGVTTSFGYEWGYAFGNQYDDGAFWFTRDGGGLWRDLPTMYEFAFKTYGY